MAKSDKTIILKIQRQPGPDKASFWEIFEIPYRKNMNVISVLMDIQANPVNAQGKRTTPVAWECSCLEEVCGACSMRINGRTRQSCSALIDELDQPIVLQPMAKFPVVRDLHVDRSRMFEDLKKVRAWVDIDGTHDMGKGPLISPAQQAIMYILSRCMTCGCCLDACPQVNSRSSFIGPSAISQARLFNMHPTGAMQRDVRLRALMGPGGVTDCGNAQNCIEACPKSIPLTDSIADICRQTTKLALFGSLWK
jgi:succinate dehydrogenase / fumarate reductase iron-sulfur subunit